METNGNELYDKVGAYVFLAEPFHCDFSKRLFMGQLGNHLLNAADFHANDRGFGMEYLNPMHKTWVLSRLAVEMSEMPAEYSRFTVETWIEGVMKYFTNRNYRIVDADDHAKVYGYARSVWAMIDTGTRHPEDILAVKDGAVARYVCADKACGMLAPSRVKMTAAAEPVATIDTHYSDVDVNGHINSVKYIEHVLDLFGIDWYKANRLRRLDVAYVAESRCGDRLKFYREDQADGSVCIRVMRLSDGAGEVEACRCRLEFEKCRCR